MTPASAKASAGRPASAKATAGRPASAKATAASPVWKTLAVARKEMRQIVRDRRTLSILLFVPAFFLLVYGYALNFDIRHVRIAVQDNDRSTASREVISSFVNSGYFDLYAEVVTDEQISETLDRNLARAVLVIPQRFGADVAAGVPTSVQFIVNGDNANTATTVVGYANSLVGATSARYELALQRADDTRWGAEAHLGSPTGPLLNVEPRVFYNPELRSTLFLVPGLIAYIAMLTAVVSTALSIVREKEAGTMEQVRMSPIGPVPYILGKTAPYFVVSLVSAMGIVLAAMLMFDMPMRGSWLVLLAVISLFLVGALGLGLFISSLADTQQVAFQIALLSSFLPTLMLSGFIFPIASMPQFLQVVTRVVPARYFLVALRGIVLKGTGPEVFWDDLVALAVFAFLILGLASLRLKRQWA
jgi:ABC-2 type transport system permease protein